MNQFGIPLFIRAAPPKLALALSSHQRRLLLNRRRHYAASPLKLTHEA
jgi:hypothetical protein